MTYICRKPSADNDAVEWLPMTNQYGPYLRIDNPCSMQENFFNEYNITITEGLEGERLHEKNIASIAHTLAVSYSFISVIALQIMFIQYL